jgi:beta-aspartyl-peptidase (threonine type)
VLLAGEGAERFARAHGVRLAPRSYFGTRKRLTDLMHGTVGAVALDSLGNLAAGTSTGGVTGKHPGRVGDSPIIGAGTYADNETCAVSGTGVGEAFMRVVLAHEVAARVRYLREPLARAASGALESLGRVGGSGGLVALDRRGRLALPFNTEGMYRGWITRTGRPEVAIRR